MFIKKMFNTKHVIYCHEHENYEDKHKLKSEGNDVDSHKRITYSDLVKQTCQVKTTMQ